MLILNLDNTFTVTFRPNSSLTANSKLKVILMDMVPSLLNSTSPSIAMNGVTGNLALWIVQIDTPNN